jgi:MFS family permease
VTNDPPTSAKEHRQQRRAEHAAEEAHRAASQTALGETVAPQIPPGTADFPQAVRALRNLDFRYFWLGNFLSNTGTWMGNVAQGWLVLLLADRMVAPGVRGDAAFWLGLVGFASASPMLVFTLIGGVIADRVDRRNLIMRTQTAMMVFAFLLAGLTYFDVITIPMIVLLAFATGVAMSLNTPSYQALVPQLVPREDLTNAIALNSAQFNMSRVIGPTVGGFAIAWFGIAGNFFLNGLSFFAVLLALRRIRYPAVRRGEGESFWRGLSDGFRYLWKRREMSTLVLLTALVSTLGFPFIIFIPLFARDILGADERGLGFLMACSGLGAFLGAATLAAMGSFRRRGRFVVANGAVFLVTVILFALSRDFYLSAILLFAAGASMILMVANINALLQHLSKEEMRGRVMSIYATAFLGFAPIGSLLAGALAGMVTAPYALAGMSGVALLGTLGLYFTRRELRGLD